MCVNISAPHPLFFPSLFLSFFFFVSCVANTLCVLPALPPGNTVRPVKNRGALQRRRDYLLSISADDLPEDVLESGGAWRRRSGLANAKKGHFHTSCRQQRKPLSHPARPILFAQEDTKRKQSGFAFLRDVLINEVRESMIRPVKIPPGVFEGHGQGGKWKSWPTSVEFCDPGR